jgi:hypothetical protein
MDINLYAAWLGMLLGGIAGAIPGLFFHQAQWLGGYDAWPRRMVRLGHISFFGIAFINLAFALTARSLGIDNGLVISSRLLLVAAIAMPLVCYLSAFKQYFRQLFFIPALSAIIGIALFFWRIAFA